MSNTATGPEAEIDMMKRRTSGAGLRRLAPTAAIAGRVVSANRCLASRLRRVRAWGMNGSVTSA